MEDVGAPILTPSLRQAVEVVLDAVERQLSPVIQSSTASQVVLAPWITLDHLGAGRKLEENVGYTLWL